MVAAMTKACTPGWPGASSTECASSRERSPSASDSTAMDNWHPSPTGLPPHSAEHLSLCAHCNFVGPERPSVADATLPDRLHDGPCGRSVATRRRGSAGSVPLNQGPQDPSCNSDQRAHRWSWTRSRPTRLQWTHQGVSRRSAGPEGHRRPVRHRASASRARHSYPRRIAARRREVCVGSGRPRWQKPSSTRTRGPEAGAAAGRLARGSSGRAAQPNWLP